ncbi:pseudouridine synthase [Methanoplanus sp. FWC-SCC4]|uniref:Pseudouridine synthase n=1 Tax=Methanochimaera problematica TaxID=2609417 RepID=A0AA97FCA6_9EURY|nr:archaeosine synthase subunit alpha [Methanoplanus sp. FWC-SCC4]WOF15589.1 pseudouridine synthase [Methanoplanus sp. FWC-SCC4]
MFEVLKRDGFSRTGLYKEGEISLNTPLAVDPEEYFPDLDKHPFSNIPVLEGEKFVSAYAPSYQNIHLIHPEIKQEFKSGDVLLAANFHTLLENSRLFVETITGLKSGTPPDTMWYIPGAALPSNVATLISAGFDLFDYRAVDLKSAQGFFCTPDGEFLAADVTGKGLCQCEGCKKGDLRMHNRIALDCEIATVIQFIESGHIREFLERRCRNSASQVAILRLFDESYNTIEKYIPIVRSKRLFANSGESLKRAEVKRFVERVIDRFVPTRTDVAVLIPCSARKPYSNSQSHMKFQSAIQNRAHEIIVTSPLGIVPRELERIYPAGHYDVPVTGYWDGEERAFITDVIARYFEKNRYEKVFVHLDGDSFEIAKEALERTNTEYECTATERLTSSDSLKSLESALRGYPKIKPDLIKGTLSWQFGKDIDTKNLLLKGKFRREKVLFKKKQFFSIDNETGLFRPTLEGWDLISPVYKISIDNFIPKGDVLAPGVIDCDPEIREGDEVLVTGEKAIATGKAVMGADEMLKSSRGVAVRVRKVKKLEE